MLMLALDKDGDLMHVEAEFMFCHHKKKMEQNLTFIKERQMPLLKTLTLLTSLILNMY